MLLKNTVKKLKIYNNQYTFFKKRLLFVEDFFKDVRFDGPLLISKKKLRKFNKRTLIFLFRYNKIQIDAQKYSLKLKKTYLFKNFFDTTFLQNNKKKKLQKDILYNSYYIAKLINVFMKNGKKTLIYNLFFKLLFVFKQIFTAQPEYFLFKLFFILRLPLNIKYIKKSGRLLPIAQFISLITQIPRTLNLLKKNVQQRNELTFFDRLYNESLETLLAQKSYSLKKNINTLMLAFDNRTNIGNTKLLRKRIRFFKLSTRKTFFNLKKTIKLKKKQLKFNSKAKYKYKIKNKKFINKKKFKLR
jgi:ribosomal protein S7